jgi:hypothetical protein
MKLSFEFSIEEANLVLEGLRELQFKRVIELMQKIESEAKAQLSKPELPIIEE